MGLPDDTPVLNPLDLVNSLTVGNVEIDIGTQHPRFMLLVATRAGGWTWMHKRVCVLQSRIARWYILKTKYQFGQILRALK
jgi:hypothetical protein